MIFPVCLFTRQGCEFITLCVVRSPFCPGVLGLRLVHSVRHDFCPDLISQICYFRFSAVEDIKFNPDQLSIGFANCKSIQNKGPLIYDTIIANILDIIALSHTRPVFETAACQPAYRS